MYFLCQIIGVRKYLAKTSSNPGYFSFQNQKNYIGDKLPEQVSFSQRYVTIFNDG